MLESVYITLIVLSFVCLIVSLLIKSEMMLSKLILGMIAMLLFLTLGIVSAEVEVIKCTSTTCSSSAFFYDENAWIFYGFGMISFFISIVFSWLLLAELRRGAMG